MADSLDPGVCLARLDALYAAWERAFAGIDCLMVLTGKPNKSDEDEDDDINTLPGTIHLWMFRLIFPETLLVFRRDRRVCFSAKGKKMNILKQLGENAALMQAYQLEFHPRESDANIAEHFRSGLLPAFEGCRTIGTILDCKLAKGPAADQCIECLGFPKNGRQLLQQLQSNAELGVSQGLTGGPIDTTVTPQCLLDAETKWYGVDVSLMELVLSTLEVEDALNASMLSGRIMREVLISSIAQYLTKGDKVTHSKVVLLADAVLEDKTRMAKWKEKYNVNPIDIDISYATCESTQGTQVPFELCFNNQSAESSEYNLTSNRGTICVGVGVKYNNICGNACRTILLDVDEAVQNVYQQMLDIQIHIQTHIIKPGMTFSAVFQQALTFIEGHHPELYPYVDRRAGFGGAIGYNVEVKHFKFDAESTENVVKENMAVTFGLTVRQYRTPKDDSAPLDFWLYDTALVAANGIEAASVRSNCCPKSKEKVSFTFEVMDSKAPAPSPKQREGDEPRKETTPPDVDVSVATRVRTRRQMGGWKRMDEMEKLASKQRELRRKKLEELRERFRDGSTSGFSQNKKTVKKLDHYVAYRDAVELPKDLRPNKIFIDSVRETILIPYENRHIPFHVAMLRNVNHQDEDGRHLLRFVFHAPGSSTYNRETNLPDLSLLDNKGEHLFIKELIVSSVDVATPSLFKAIKDLMKKQKDREAHNEDMDNMDPAMAQQSLILNRSGKSIVLRSLSVRHSGGYIRKTLGQLEAHINGFRYTAPRMEAIDILYSNIRFCFFQPVDNEMIILIHLHLKSPIMIAKKKVKDVQFYCETSTQTDDVDSRRHNNNYHRMNDPDEILEEMREMERRAKLNVDFRRFLELTQQQAAAHDCKLDIEVPMKKLSFYGVPDNSLLTLMPTHSALVHLVEWPPFILPLDEVELVSFERVVHGVRNIDIIFIRKDYSKKVKSVCNVPVESLDMIKAWLNDMDLVWYEGNIKLNWDDVLKYIRDNMQAFLDDGGFRSFLVDEIGERSKKVNGSDEEDAEQEGDEGSNSDEDSDDDSEDVDFEGSSDPDSSEDDDEEVASEEEPDDDEDDEDDEDIDSEEEEEEEEDSEEVESEEEERPAKRGARPANTRNAKKARY